MSVNFITPKCLQLFGPQSLWVFSPSCSGFESRDEKLKERKIKRERQTEREGERERQTDRQRQRDRGVREGEEE